MVGESEHAMRASKLVDACHVTDGFPLSGDDGKL